MFTLESFVRNERVAEGQVGSYVTNVQELNGDGHFDPGLDRPYRDDRGRVWVDVTVGHEQVKDSYNQPVFNSRGEPKYRSIFEPQLVRDRQNRDLPVLALTTNATVLRKDQWAQIDATVQRAVRLRMRLWADLRASSTFGGFDGMATPVLAFERVTDAGEAIVDMDGMTEGRNFAPKFSLDGMPLPITHSDFFLSSRFLAISRARGGLAADTLRMEMAARRVGEVIEQTAIGTTSLAHVQADLAAIGGSGVGKIYGILNHPDIITKTNMTAPTAGGWVANTTYNEVLACLELLSSYQFFGPFVIYHSTDWDQYLDQVFSLAGGNNPGETLRSMLRKVPRISDIRRLDYLTSGGGHPFTMVFVQMGEEVQAVNGMEVVTVQWESMGGMRLNFKVMGIQVPRIRSVLINSNVSGGPASSTTQKTPILVATTS